MIQIFHTRVRKILRNYSIIREIVRFEMIYFVWKIIGMHYNRN